jgi:NAD-dependent SIR2 family protein deacetylase
MQLDKVFELVRKEDVVLWIGSGFSLYAGYPTGKQLSDTIYHSLSSAEREEIYTGLSLIDLGEEYVRIKGGSKNALIALLKREFSKKPASLKWHKIIEKIPHIKTIITTNYDQLFEAAYGSELNTIISESDIPYRDKKTDLLKIHGDISHPNSIIITRTDYNNFFRKNIQDNLIWTTIKERISNKSIVFIGYDLEDSNVTNLLQDVYDSLGTNRKEIFLIAPGLKQHKVAYLNKLGIQYFDSKGETFIEKLFENIKDNVTDDFSKGLVSVETANEFYRKNGLAVDYKSIGNQLKISSFKSANSSGSGSIELKFKNDREFLNSFKAFTEGRTFGEFQINGNQLDHLRVLLEEVNILGKEHKDFSLKFIHTPLKEGKASIRFDDGAEFEDLKYKVYRSVSLLSIVSEYKDCTYTLEVSTDAFNSERESVTTDIKFHSVDRFKNVNDAILAHKLYLKIINGEPATLFASGEKSFYFRPRRTQNTSTPILSTLDFLEDLKKVESIYRVKFENIGNFTEEDFDNVYKAVMVANKAPHIQEWDNELEWELSKNMPLELILKIDGGAQLAIESTTLEKVMILGQEIILGYLMAEPQDLYILNHADITNGGTTAKVRSKSKRIKLWYSLEGVKSIP